MRTKIFALALSVLLTAAILVLPIRFGSSDERSNDMSQETAIKFNLTKYSVIQNEHPKPAASHKKSKSDDKSLSKEQHSKNELPKDMSFAPTENQTQHSESEPAKDMSFENTDGSEHPENESAKDMSFGNPSRSEHSTQDSQTAKQMVYKPDFKIDKRPIYPAAARRMGQQGRVGLTVFVDKSGKVINVIAAPSSGFSLLDNAAISAVKQWKFGSLNLQNQVNVIKTEVIFELN